MSDLALFDHAREALAAAVRTDEVLSIRDRARQAEAYAKIARDRRMIADAQEIIARAERKLGIMLRRAKDDGLISQGGRPQNSNIGSDETGTDDGPVFDSTPFTLSEIGVSKNLSSRAQKLAAIDDATFESSLAARRDATLTDETSLIRTPRLIRVAPKAKAPIIAPLAEEKWHRFAFSIIALSMSSDRVSSEAVQLMAESQGIVVLDGDTIDFTPEAEKAMGPLAAIALQAIDGDYDQLKQSDAGRDAGSPSEASAVSADKSRVDAAASTLAAALAALELREAYQGEIALLGSKLGTLNMAEAEPALRAGRAAKVSPLLISQDLGHPLGTIKTWLSRLGLTSLEHMEQMNAARAAEAHMRKGTEP